MPSDAMEGPAIDRAASCSEDGLEEGFLQNEGDGLDDEQIEISHDGGLKIMPVVPESCPSKPEAGNHKIWAHFGRKRTHNEELCVVSCGVILGRATFYGSEGPNWVHVSGLVITACGHAHNLYVHNRNSGRGCFPQNHRCLRCSGWTPTV
jgi:hypothetical protein